MRIPRQLTGAIRILLGTGLAVGLVYFTLKSTGSDLWAELIRAQRPLLGLALFSYGGSLGVTIYRWNLLLRVQGVYLGAWDLIRLTMIGVFFNLALPGAVGGDLIKTAFLARQASHKKVEALLTVVLDRALGIFGLFIVASVMVLLYLPFLLGLRPEYRPIQIAAFIVGLGSVAGVGGLALLELRASLMQWPWIVRVVDYGKRKLPAMIVSSLERLVNALELYRRTRRTIALAIGLSILVHSCLALTLFCIGASVGEEVLRLGDYFLATQVSNAVAGIPVTPAGIGTRDGVTAMFLTALKATPAKAGVVPVTMTLIILFWGLVGGIVFVASRVPKVETRLSDVFSREELSNLSPEKLEAH